MGDPLRKLKKIIIVILILVGLFVVYVEIANRNSKNMTYRQKVLKAVYPALMWFTKLTGKNTKELSRKAQEPPVSFYTLSAVANNGDSIGFDLFQEKKILIVNTASNCGYTGQYSDLQELAEKYPERLVVIGFPANDFKEQEKGSDEEIAAFCKKNFGVSFPLMKKSVVIKTAEQNPVFRWLTDPALNGWNSQAPSWNFSKYLVNEKGMLIRYFGPSVSPLSDQIISAITE